MRILVAGASGVVGRRIVPLLLDAGHDVAGLSRSAAATEVIRGLGAHAVAANALDPTETRDAVAEARPEVVLNMLTDLAASDSVANALIRVQGRPRRNARSTPKRTSRAGPRAAWLRRRT